MDSYLQPMTKRYQRGRESAEGYYYDSFNYPLLIQNVLEPLSPGGNLQIRKSVTNLSADSTSEEPLETVNKDAILLLDGVFLMRKELLNYWDVKIYVDISFEIALERALERDLNKFESISKLKRMHELRYFSGQRIYFEFCQEYNAFRFIN